MGEKKPQCYAMSRNTWRAMLYTKSRNSINVTVPVMIVRELGLRPGMTCKFTIELEEDEPSGEGLE